MYPTGTIRAIHQVLKKQQKTLKRACLSTIQGVLLLCHFPCYIFCFKNCYIFISEYEGFYSGNSFFPGQNPKNMFVFIITNHFAICYNEHPPTHTSRICPIKYIFSIQGMAKIPKSVPNPSNQTDFFCHSYETCRVQYPPNTINSPAHQLTLRVRKC